MSFGGVITLFPTFEKAPYANKQVRELIFSLCFASKFIDLLCPLPWTLFLQNLMFFFLFSFWRIESADRFSRLFHPLRVLLLLSFWQPFTSHLAHVHCPILIWQLFLSLKKRQVRGSLCRKVSKMLLLAFLSIAQLENFKSAKVLKNRIWFYMQCQGRISQCLGNDKKRKLSKWLSKKFF